MGWLGFLLELVCSAADMPEGWEGRHARAHARAQARYAAARRRRRAAFGAMMAAQGYAVGPDGALGLARPGSRAPLAERLAANRAALDALVLRTGGAA